MRCLPIAVGRHRGIQGPYAADTGLCRADAGLADVAWVCETCNVREREFWQLLEEVFGRVYGRSLSRDQRLPKLGDMTVVEALDAGEEPRVVWNVLCDQMDIPDSKRWGKDHNAPPLPAGR